MKLEPIDPQKFTDFETYSEKEAPVRNAFLTKSSRVLLQCVPQCSCYSLYFFSLFMSLWFFWRTLYLPEIQQHARYLGVELEILNNPDLRIFHNDAEVDVDTWLENRVGIEYITDPKRISECS